MDRNPRTMCTLAQSHIQFSVVSTHRWRHKLFQCTILNILWRHLLSVRVRIVVFVIIFYYGGEYWVETKMTSFRERAQNLATEQTYPAVFLWVIVPSNCIRFGKKHTAGKHVFAVEEDAEYKPVIRNNKTPICFYRVEERTLGTSSTLANCNAGTLVFLFIRMWNHRTVKTIFVTAGCQFARRPWHAQVLFRSV